MSNKRQALDFLLVRSGKLSGNEVALLCYINSFSSFCAPRKLVHIGESLGWCDRKVRMVIDLLVAKGLVKKRYTTFKRVILTLASLADQEFFRKSTNVVLCVLRNLSKLRGKRHDRQKGAELNRQTSAEPIKNKTPEEQNILGEGFFKIKSVMGERQKESKQEMLARFEVFRAQNGF